MHQFLNNAYWSLNYLVLCESVKSWWSFCMQLMLIACYQAVLGDIWIKKLLGSYRSDGHVMDYGIHTDNRIRIHLMVTIVHCTCKVPSTTHNLYFTVGWGNGWGCLQFNLLTESLLEQSSKGPYYTPFIFSSYPPFQQPFSLLFHALLHLSLKGSRMSE